MKKLLLASVSALLLAAPAFAQAPPTQPTAAFSTSGAVGQNNGGAINQTTFNNNSDPAGFSDTALTPSLAVPATSTAQATGPLSQTGTLITTRTTVITTCSATTGPTLPSVQRFASIVVINRSGGSCLIFPSVGATVESAPGTAGAVNAPMTMLTNTDIIFRPISATTWLQ